MTSMLTWAYLGVGILLGEALAGPVMPTTGSVHNLVVFIRFADQPAFARPLSDYEGLFNSASASLKNFYLENSYGKLTVNSSFYPTSSGAVLSYQDAHSTGYYQPFNASTNPQGYQGAQSTSRENALVTQALNAIAAQIPSNLNLDINGDGYLDHVTFEVYSSDAHPLPGLFYSRATLDASDGVTVKDLKLGNYTWVTSPQDNPVAYPGGTEIHEMGHSLGYPDLRANNGRTPVGAWDVMSLSTPVHSGAYMKNRFTRWIADIPEITAYGSYTLNDITQPLNNAYRLKLPGSNEFLVLEYRRASGPFESNLPASGLCITRVNESAGVYGNLGGPPYFLYYFRPDGYTSSDGPNQVTCFDAEAGHAQFNDHSNPSCFLSDGRPCGISIYNIGAASGPSMSFSVGDPAVAVVSRSLSGYLYNGGNRVAGATVRLSGDATGSMTTGSLGKYLFLVSDGGNYTVTPIQPDLTFLPASQSYTQINADQVKNFAATNKTVVISGKVVQAGLPVSGAAVYCTGGNYPPSGTTDASGMYSFTVHVGFDYEVWPSHADYYFAPASKVLQNLTASQTVNFAGTPRSQPPNTTNLTNASPLTVAPGQTVIAPVSTTVSGATITLTRSVATVNPAPVNLRIGSESLALTPLGADAVIQLKAITVDGVPALVPTLVQGQVAASAGPNQALLATGRTVASVRAGTSGASITQSADESGAGELSVLTGELRLPASSFLPLSLVSGKVFADETARWDSSGKVVQVRLTTNVGAGGDPWKSALPASVQRLPAVADLRGTPGRLNGSTPLAGLAAAVSQAMGVAMQSWEQNNMGVVTLKFAGGALHVLPVGAVVVDTSVSDGVTVANGGVSVASQGLVVQVVPSTGNYTEFAARLRAVSADTSITVGNDGTMHFSLAGAMYALLPDYLAAAAPVGRAPGAVWVDETGKLFMAYADGSAQGFTLQ